MWFVLVIALLSLVVIALAWRQHQARARAEQERKDRRARADQVLARVLLGEDGAERRPLAVPPGLAAEPEAAAASAPAPPVAAVPGQPLDIDILLADESTTIAEQARRELGRPTTMLSDLGSAAGAGAAPGPLSLLDGRIDAPLDALVLAWFSARGYVAARAPETALPIRLLLTHRDDSERSYAFFFDRGRLHALRAAELLEKAHALGMNRLLVAAEHGADPAVSSARLRDVLVMDWVALDRELRKIDFQVAAKIVALARSRRDVLGLG